MQTDAIMCDKMGSIFLFHGQLSTLTQKILWGRIDPGLCNCNPTILNRTAPLIGNRNGKWIREYRPLDHPAFLWRFEICGNWR